MKITFTLEQVKQFHALSPADQNKVLEVANNLKNESDDNIENSTIDTTAPLLAQELTENAINRIKRRRERHLALERKRKLADQQPINDKKSTKPAKRAKEVWIGGTMNPETARHMMWLKTNFDKFSSYVNEGFSLLKTHMEGARIYDKWSTMFSELREDLNNLWRAAIFMLHNPIYRQKPYNFVYQMIVA